MKTLKKIGIGAAGKPCIASGGRERQTASGGGL